MTMATPTVEKTRAEQPAAPARSKRDWLEHRYAVYPVIAVVIILIAWDLVVRVGELETIYLPAPSKVFSALWTLFTEGGLVTQILITLGRIGAGFAVATVVGVAVGMLMNSFKGLRSLSNAFIAAFYPLPKIALIPILIIWLGSGESYKILISAISAYFPIVVNTYLGVRLVDQGLLKAARDLGLSRHEIQRKVVIPGALPSILAGLHLGLGISVVMVVAAEMVAGNNGLGYELLYAGQVMQTESVFAILVVLTVLGWAITQTQKWLDRVIAPWANE